MIRLFGIPNCDTMKKARRWLEERGIAYDFHDYKKQGLDEAGAIRVMLATPSIIRRPLLDTGQARYLGFSEAAYAEIFPA